MKFRNWFNWFFRRKFLEVGKISKFKAKGIKVFV